ncbi:hypothetical protein TNCV_3850851 [Trichonephila clavipes]|nr:hypothetical protein TNCV_3850851 [Trichonephila clavipes]
MACLVMNSGPVPLKTCRVGQRCTFNLSQAETSSRWCGVVVRREGSRSVNEKMLENDGDVNVKDTVQAPKILGCRVYSVSQTVGCASLGGRIALHEVLTSFQLSVPRHFLFNLKILNHEVQEIELSQAEVCKSKFNLEVIRSFFTSGLQTNWRRGEIQLPCCLRLTR